MIPYSALILAGGQGQRMGGQDKGWVTYQQRPLIEWALDIIHSQTWPPEAIYLSANRHLDAYRALGYPVLTDATPDFLGPLAGVLAGLAQSPTEWMWVIPCDAVQLPSSVAQTLFEVVQAQNVQAVTAIDGEGRWHPVILAVHRQTYPQLAAYLAAGGRSIRGWLATLLHESVAFSVPFPNANDLQALAADAVSGTLSAVNRPRTLP